MVETRSSVHVHCAAPNWALWWVGGSERQISQYHIDEIKHSKTGKSRKRSKTNSNSDNNEAFISDRNFARFYMISNADENTTLSALFPFVQGRAVYSEIGTLKTIKRMQRGDVLVETENRIYVDKLQQLSKGHPTLLSQHLKGSCPVLGSCRVQQGGDCQGAGTAGSHRCLCLKLLLQMSNV